MAEMVDIKQQTKFFKTKKIIKLLKSKKSLCLHAQKNTKRKKIKK